MHIFNFFNSNLLFFQKWMKFIIVTISSQQRNPIINLNLDSIMSKEANSSDEKLTYGINETLSRHPLLISTLDTISYSGTQKGFFIILALLILFFGFNFLFLLELILGLISLTLLLMVIKSRVKRERPIPKPKLEHYFDRYSFPSGHSTRAAFIFMFSILYFPYNLLWIVILLWSITIALQRLTKLRHYFTDVFFGYIIGLLYGLGFFYLTVLYNSWFI